MTEEEQKKDGIIYTCRVCTGSGFMNGSKCKECEGMGVVLWLGGEVYYWQKKVTYLGIRQERQARKARLIINSLCFIFGIVGLLSLFKVFFDLAMAGSNWGNFIYRQDEFTRLFWVSILVDMYLLYRLSRESRVKYLVKQKPQLHLAQGEREYEFDWYNIAKYKKKNIAGALNQAAQKSVNEAWILASKLRHANLEQIHLFAVLVSQAEVNLVFARLGVDYNSLLEKIKHGLNKIIDTGQPQIGKVFRETVLRAYLQAYNQRKPKVTPTDFLFAVANVEGIVKEILYEAEITEREINNVVKWVDLQKSLLRRWREFRYKASFKPKRSMDRAYTAVATPNLDRISRDMTLYARAGGYSPLVGREKELMDIFRVLEEDKLGAVLVGSVGVGKKSIIEGVARLMVKEEVPKLFQDKRLVSLSVAGLIAGASQVGDLEGRILKVMAEIAKAKNIIVFIEDIHHLVGVSTDNGEAMDVAEALAEQMQKYNFYVLATTTPEYYKQYIERSSLAKVLQRIVIDEVKDDEAIRILEAKALEMEARHQVYFSYQAIKEAVKWTKRFIHDEYLPEKAIKVLEEAILLVKQKRGERATVGKEDVAEVVAGLTGVPVTKVETEESQKLLNLEQMIHERVIGQEPAVKLVASALRRARTELRGQNRPIASFLFLGSTGVGKTEVAKTLARVYFGSEKNMVRLDMSEYQADDALAKLLGDSRRHTGGYLTEAVRKRPFTLVLLDEIEKAHPDILNVFLQVLDDGRLTDAMGKTIDFTNTIVIGTSNAGTKFIQEGIKKGEKLDDIRNMLIGHYLKEIFRPEFLNRFDGIVVFRPLEMKHVVEIAKLFLNDLAKRLEEKGVEFRAEIKAVEKLAELGYDQTLGARPLRRVIQDRVEDQLARLLLEGKLKRRDEVILKDNLELGVKKAERI